MRLFIFQNEIYQNHAFMRPANPLRYASYMLGLRASPYLAEELDGGEQAIMNETLEAIDALRKSKFK